MSQEKNPTYATGTWLRDIVTVKKTNHSHYSIRIEIGKYNNEFLMFSNRIFLRLRWCPHATMSIGLPLLFPPLLLCIRIMNTK